MVQFTVGHRNGCRDAGPQSLLIAVSCAEQAFAWVLQMQAKNLKLLRLKSRAAKEEPADLEACLKRELLELTASSIASSRRASMAGIILERMAKLKYAGVDSPLDLVSLFGSVDPSFLDAQAAAQPAPASWLWEGDRLRDGTGAAASAAAAAGDTSSAGAGAGAGAVAGAGAGAAEAGAGAGARAGAASSAGAGAGTGAEIA